MSMVLARIDGGDELAKLGCTLESDMPTFWKAMARRVKRPPPDMEQICDKVAAEIESDYGAETVEEMTHVVGERQLEQLLTRCGGKATWRGLVEYVIGLKFQSSAPSSAQLALTEVGETPKVVVKTEPTFEAQPLGALMTVDGSLHSDILPEYVLDAHEECEDPNHQELTASDIKNVLNAYTHYMITHHRQPAGDKVMMVWHAKQLKKRYPHLCNHGLTSGVSRKWLGLLKERKRNVSRLATKSGVGEPPNHSRSSAQHTCCFVCKMHRQTMVALAPSTRVASYVMQAKLYQGLTFTQSEVDNNPGVKAMMGKGFVPNVNDHENRDKRRLSFGERPTVFEGEDSDSDNDDELPPEKRLKSALDVRPTSTQEERDRAKKQVMHATNLAALDAEVEAIGSDSDETPQSSRPTTGQKKGKAPTANQRRKAAAATAQADKEEEKARKKAEKEEEKARKKAEKEAERQVCAY
jgi:hypothetical protein